MRTPVPFDVVVVGGGPVGCLAAVHLARRGFSVQLLERGVWARPGGPYINGVSQRFLPVFERLGAGPAVAAAQLHVGHHLVLGGAHGGRMDGEWSEGSRRVFFRRGVADRMLRGDCVAAGVTVVDGARSVTPVMEAGRVTGVTFQRGQEEHHTRCRLLAVADGRLSKTADALAIPLSTQQRFTHLYLGRRFHGTRFEPGTFRFLATRQPGVNALVFRLGEAEGADGSAYVELEVDLTQHPGFMSTFRGDAMSALAQVASWNPTLAQGLDGAQPEENPWHAIHFSGGWRTRMCVPGAVLLGDAAACVDPISSSGLTVGLSALEDLLETTQGRPLDAWELQGWEARSLERAADVRLFASAFRLGLGLPRMWDAGLRVLQRSVRRKQVLLDAFNGSQRYSELLSLPGMLAWVGPQR
jgi:2-polyprenyl-6-methoxyphenol hydroxylase-like FAD-dependent oxidoreductase